MASTPSSSSLFASRSNGLATPQSTPQSGTTKSAGPTPRRSIAIPSKPIKVESSSPYRSNDSGSRAASFLSKTPFGTPNSNRNAAITPSSHTASLPSGTTSTSPPAKPLTGRAQLMARIRSLWLGGGYTTSSLQAKSFLPYSGFAKLMLQTNLDRLYVLSFLSVHIFLSLSLFVPLQPISSLLLPIQPFLVLISIAAFSLSILPLIQLRRWAITNTTSTKTNKGEGTQGYLVAGITLPFGSPAAHYYSTLCQSKMAISIAIYAVSGLFLASSHAIGLMLYSPDSNSWTPYQSVSFRNAQGLRITSFRPNERLFFLLGSNFIIGAIFTLHRSLSLSSTSPPYSTPRFEPQATVESLGVRLSNKLRQRLPTVLLAGALLPSLLLALYIPIRRPLFRLVLSIIGHDSALRPLLIPSFRHYFLSVGLLFRTTSLGIFSTASWEIINILWEVFSTQPFADLPGGLSRYSREPTKCLIEGMQSRRRAHANETSLTALEREYYSHFAFAEMALLAATDVERRRAIFREVGSTNMNAMEGGSRSAWVLIVHECLKVLEEERLCLTTKGKQVISSTSTTSSTQSISHLKALDPNHRATVESGTSVVKKGPATIWDRLASPGTASSPAAPAAPSTTTTSLPTQTTASTNTTSPDGLSGLLHRLAPTPLTNAVAKSTPAAASTTALKATSTNQSSMSTSTALLSFLLTSTVNIFKTIFVLLPPDLRHVLSRLPIIRSFGSIKEYIFTPSNQTLLYTSKIPREVALTTWSIQTMSALLSASIDQDEYGTIALSSNQKMGVDDVLNEIADLLLALSQWGQDIAKEMQGESDSRKQELTLLWDRRVAPLVIASRTAINLVLGVFQPTGFHLRPSVQEKVERAMAAG